MIVFVCGRDNGVVRFLSPLYYFLLSFGYWCEDVVGLRCRTLCLALAPFHSLN